MPNITQIPAPRVPLVDMQSSTVSREWFMWFNNVYTIAGSGTGIVAVINGGTGLGTIPTAGQLLIGNGTGYTLNTLGVGVGISVTNGAGTISLANTGVLSNIAGAGISVSSATGNVTIANTGVLSFSGGTTGLTPATATIGAVVLSGTLKIANGGTNGTAVPTAGAIAYGAGTAYAFSAAGTAGQVLTSAGAGTPTWATPTAGTVTSVSGTGTVNGISLSGTVTTSGSLTLGGALSGVSLTSQVTGILPVANGGTGTGVAYTVATLPTPPVQGRRAWVTDALAPVFLAAPVAGGTVVCPVFDNGTAWVVG